MKCKQARRLFGAYWDDELTQAEREWLEAHFASCAGCRSGYEELARTIELASSLPREEVAAGFAEQVRARARRAAAEPDRVPAAAPRWIPVTAAIALVAVLAATVFQWAGPGGPSRERATELGRIEQPTLVDAVSPQGSAAGDLVSAADPSATVASIPDSIFDHGEDVEFILDPVTLRKGRARTVVPGPKRDERPARQAVITF